MVVALYYYGPVVAQLYCGEPSAEQPPAFSSGLGYTFALGLNLIGTLLLGILPAPILQITERLSSLVG